MRPHETVEPVRLAAPVGDRALVVVEFVQWPGWRPLIEVLAKQHSVEATRRMRDPCTLCFAHSPFRLEGLPSLFAVEAPTDFQARAVEAPIDLQAGRIQEPQEDSGHLKVYARASVSGVFQKKVQGARKSTRHSLGMSVPSGAATVPPSARREALVKLDPIAPTSVEDVSFSVSSMASPRQRFGFWASELSSWSPAGRF